MVLASLLWLLSRINSDRVAHQVANNDSMLEWMVLPMFPCYAHFVTYFGNRFDPLPIHIHKQSKGRHCSLLVPSQSSGRNFYPSHGPAWSWLWVIVIKWADRPGPPPPARLSPPSSWRISGQAITLMRSSPCWWRCQLYWNAPYLK